MAQSAQRQAIMPAPRYSRPAIFGGTDAAWRVLCDMYPSAETPEIIMAVVEYCATKRLDPYRRPVHIVPMYNAKLRRRVQVVMQGINEIEITASRTGTWAGIDAPVWGEDVTRTFRGTVEGEDGSKQAVEKTLTFPVSCALTVYRIVGGAPRKFTEQLFFEECYATAGFRSEVPNERWSKAPRQMLHKCTKAAVLRAAFPEEGLGYAAEEMEDQFTEAGGVTIDGKIDHGDAGMTARDRQAAEAYPSPPPGEATGASRGLEETNSTLWLRNLHELLRGADSATAVVEIGGHASVRRALTTAPTLIRQQINEALKAAHERVSPADDNGHSDEHDSGWPDDPIAELVAEVEEMDTDALDVLATSAAWRTKTRDLFPPDEDRLNDAIARRRATLKGSTT